MASGVYSARLLNGQVTPTEGLTFTCPAGYVAVVLAVDAVAYEDPSEDDAVNMLLNGVSFYLGVASGGAESFGPVTYRGRITMYPGDTLEVLSDTYVAVNANGYLLAGSPPPI